MSGHGRYILFAFCFFVMTLLTYPVFRGAVTVYVRRVFRVRKRDITHLLKGKKNFWFYEELGRRYDIKKLCRLNSMFIYSFIAYPILLVPVFFMKRFALVHYIFAVVHFILHVRMMWFSSGENNLKEHGVRRVLFSYSKSKGVSSVIFDVLCIVCMVLVILSLGDFMLGLVFGGLKVGYYV